jgi:hypothetical protein
MHTHPTPVSIKTRITEALIQRGKSIDSITMAIVYTAIDAGIKAANEEHDKIWGKRND